MFHIATTQSDIDFEREKSAREDTKEGIPIRQFSDAYLETLAVYRKIADYLLSSDTLLFHGSVIAVDGEGYLLQPKAVPASPPIQVCGESISGSVPS